MPADLKTLGENIVERLGGAVESFEFAQDELVLKAKRDEIVNVLTHLRDDGACRFTQLVDVTAADYPSRPERFEVVYNMLSISNNTRVRGASLTVVAVFYFQHLSVESRKMCMYVKKAHLVRRFKNLSPPGATLPVFL